MIIPEDDNNHSRVDRRVAGSESPADGPGYDLYPDQHFITGGPTDFVGWVLEA
ncbi:hypothetical protein [Rubinisphaera sp.]|uniref:hypothetical protein n=1 Tax=Rubinisphaera sp. TaxID=2024857 RepID=UPI0025D5DEED|nr:hypothetical protein [Rubinisphaera sp.]|tara:strand:+ start:8321 stop:8479 length:159 start_codon:yes stop_codon:yes gene_type:complete